MEKVGGLHGADLMSATGMTIKRKQLILAWFDLIAPLNVDGMWGPQSEEATRRLQKKLGIQSDGIFGKATQRKAFQAMKEDMELDVAPAVNAFWADIRYFTLEEFACKCGKYCNGYPHGLQPLLVKIAERARIHFHRPITIVSGLRCEKHNADVGGVANSQHLYGEAADVYIHGVEPDEALKWFQSQDDVRYAYRIEGSCNIHFDIAKGAR